MTRPAILVVDDEAPMRTLVAARLRARGYEVLAAADGREALELVAGRRPELLLLDLDLPGPERFALLAAVRCLTDVPVVVISASGRECDKVAALDLGADGYLAKPFGVQELLARVRAALRRAAAVPPVRGTGRGRPAGRGRRGRGGADAPVARGAGPPGARRRPGALAPADPAGAPAGEHGRTPTTPGPTSGGSGPGSGRSQRGRAAG